MSRETFEGTLTVHRQQKRARGGLLAAYLSETLAPEFYPPKGWVEMPKPEYPHWQVRFKRLPESLHGCHGHRIRVVCTPVPFHNGAGVYATRAKVECLACVEHERDRDDEREMPDRCPACGLRPTWANERLCEKCGRMAQGGGCGKCGGSHNPRTSCAELRHRADGPDDAQVWQPSPPRMPVTHADRATDEWDWAS